MKMINCFILDDEQNCIAALKALLNKHHPEVNIIGEANAAAKAFDFFSKTTIVPEILFLDIQMPEEDGFSFLSRFPHIDFSIIFTTAYDSYAIKAIKFSALDYLLKPINRAELKDALDKYRVIEQAQYHTRLNSFKNNVNQGNTFDKLAVPGLSEIIFIKLENILYLESNNNYTIIHTVDKAQIVSSKNIGHYEEVLEGLNFFRIHNSYIINLKKIKRYIRGKTGQVELEDGTAVDISKRKKEEFLNLLDLI